MTRIHGERSQRGDAHRIHPAAAMPGPGKRALTAELAPGDAHALPSALPGKRALTDALAPGALPVQRGPASAAPAAGATGAALPGPVKSRMEQLFGMDLSAVRVHEGPQARAQGALAYAQGADLHFAPGQYDPHSERGLALLGHELTHVAQHAEGRAPRPQAKGERGGGDPALEAEADAMGARVARGEAARPAGSPRLTATPDPGGAIQRMIDTSAPVDGTAWDQIERYLERTLINNRQQTFKEAVEEYIATGVTGANLVQNRWQQVDHLRGQPGQENIVLGHLRFIRTTINNHKRQVPDHPNKQGIGPGRERYETIPQSADSKRVAQTMRTTLIHSMLNRYDSRTQSYQHWNTHRWEKVRGRWSEQFMLGVLVLPSAQVRISHSGFMDNTQARIFTELVQNAGHVSEHHDDYNKVINHYGYDLNHTALPGDHVIEPNTQGKDALKYKPPGGRTEVGNPIGVCAAPQGLDDLGGTHDEFPPELTGNTPLALTEVWVSANPRSQVTVHDVNNQPQQYSGNDDVPSCLTCQHQLRIVMRTLTDLRRNVVNRDNVQREEAHRWELVAAVEQLKQILRNQQLRNTLAGRIVGLPSVDGARFEKDVLALDQHLTTYKQGIDTQAKQRTAHPEHIEHDDKTTNPNLDGLVDAEDETRVEHYESLWAKRNVVGNMIQAPAPEQRTLVAREQSKTQKKKKRPPVMEKMDKGAWGQQLWEGARLVKARDDESKTRKVEEQARTSSAQRDKRQDLEALGETTALQSAERAIDQLFGHRVRGFLTVEQAQHFAEGLRAQLAEHGQATTELESLNVGWTDSTSTKIERGSVHDHHVTPRVMTPESRKQSDLVNWRLASSVKAIEKLLGELAQAVDQGRRNRENDRDQRSNQLGERAQTSNDERGKQEDRRVRGELRGQREQEQLAGAIAGADAGSSSIRRHDREEDFSDQMWSRAMSLAQMYDTTIERQLQYLVQRDQQVNIVGPGVQPLPHNDHSSEYIG